ncbi:MAG: PEGA domain-containing protein [Myxococcales bacterium]|nr:PEGA domain-containing protein [Myxococcales bacterium]
MQTNPRSRLSTNLFIIATRLIFFAAWGVFGVPAVYAQEREAYEQELRQLYNQGKEFAEKKEYKQALIKFKAALGLFDQMNTVSRNDVEKQKLFQRRKMMLYTIARTYQYDAQEENAYKYYRDCLKEAPSKRVRELIQKHLKEIVPKLQGTIEIETAPSQVRVRLIDAWGKISTGTTPFKKTLVAGSFRVELSKDGYAALSKKLTLKKSGTLQLQYNLSSSQASFRLQSSPSGAQVKITGLNGQEYTGVTPFQQNLLPGRYEVHLFAPEHQDRNFFITLRAGGELSRHETLASVKAPVRPTENQGISKAEKDYYEVIKKHKKETEKNRIISTALGSTGGVLLAGSALTWLAGNVIIGEANARFADYTYNGQSREIYESAQTSERLRVATYILLALSGAAVITSIVFGAMSGAKPPPPPPGVRKEPPPRETPIPTKNSLGQSIQGRLLYSP